MPDHEQAHSVTDNGQIAPLGSLVANVGGRIQEMLDTAERVAGEIRADAEAAGRAYIQDRQREADRAVQERLAELDAITESLAARIANMQHEMTAFADDVEQAQWRMRRLIGENSPPSESAPDSPPASAPAAQSSASSSPESPRDAALRATQMAVAGAERSDIEHMLREDFGMDDPAAIDRVLGAGGS